MTFTSGTGATAVLHAGDVHFPPTAFIPGAVVTLTLQLSVGPPLVYRFSASVLETLK